jgi:hypothetical protein
LSADVYLRPALTFSFGDVFFCCLLFGSGSKNGGGTLDSGFHRSAEHLAKFGFGRA